MLGRELSACDCKPIQDLVALLLFTLLILLLKQADDKIILLLHANRFSVRELVLSGLHLFEFIPSLEVWDLPN